MFRYSLVGGGLQVASPIWGCNLATPPAPKRYETNNKTEKDYDTAQEKDGICAVQIIQA